MAAASSAGRTVVVAGDTTIHWNIVRIAGAPGEGPLWVGGRRISVGRHEGGAVLVGDVLAAAAKARHGAFAVRGVPRPAPSVTPGDRRYDHAYAAWAQFPAVVDAKGAESKAKAWRIADLLGLDRRAAGDRAPAADASDADVVVLEDHDLGFRDDAGAWPLPARSSGRPAPWVLLKMSAPVAVGPLWERVSCDWADRAVVVLTIDDVRRSEVQVSRALSWERTSQDLLAELLENPRLNSLSRCAHVVISFGTAGAMVVSRTAPQARGALGPLAATLHFDPRGVEGTWAQARPGEMVGYAVCVAAGVALRLVESPDAPQVDLGVRRGLAAARTLHELGLEDPAPGKRKRGLRFPVTAVVKDLLAADEGPLPEAVVRPRSTAPDWSILHDRHRGDGLEQVARRIVIDGPETALRNAPIGEFRKLLTADRREIESFRGIGNLVREYVRQPKKEPPRPLCIAVFGAPGAGKSFGITEVASSLLPKRIERITFNLSQFQDTAQLFDSLHRVRDIGLKGKLPLVFFDEFDTAVDGNPLAWLRHFLAPMQDGEFLEGQVAHPVGAAIFVFAGGVYETMTAFEHDLSPAAFRAVKGPDFVSRLKGFVDILGPNPVGGDPAKDPHHVLRRGIVLRTILKDYAPGAFRKDGDRETLQIDTGVLRAFLRTRKFRYGTRSMEAIVAGSALTDKRAFERSALPPETLMDIHVDGREFMEIVARFEPEGELLEKLARLVHEEYCASQTEKGFKFGATTDTTLLTNSRLVAFESLSDEEKDQNRAVVLDIQRKLAAAGFVMTPLCPGGGAGAALDDDVERLAEMEHARWAKAKIGAGWRYGKPRDDAKKLHPALLPWREAPREELRRDFTDAEIDAMGSDELPEHEKVKDRDSVKGIPALLAGAGLSIARLRTGGTRA